MPAETVVPPRFRTPEPRLRLHAAFALALAACALAAVLCALAPGRAEAAPAGPFDVEGPADAYAWDGAVLSVTGDGVTIAGMADPTSAAMGDVRVAAGVGAINVGSGVRIGTLSFAEAAALRLDGAGNEVQLLDLARSSSVSGPGSVTLAEVTLSLDLLPSATVTLTGSADGMSIWAGATLVLGPGASLGNITHFGGTLDLSHIVFGAPVRVLGYSVGGDYTSNTIVAPFGATRLSELMTLDHLFVNGGDTAIVEDGERVGTLQDDGSFLITATRTVTFAGWEGKVLATEEVPLFSAATAPEVVAPEGYRFTGWDVDFTHVVQDLAVTAQFEKLPDPTPQPEPAPAPPAGGSGAPSAASASTSVPASRYYPAPKKLAATGDAAGWGLGTAAAAGSAAAVAAVVAAAIGRRRG